MAHSRASIRASSAPHSAAVRRAGGERMAAARDLVIAGARYTDGLDRAPVAHALASQLLTGGDVEGAREALLVALEQGERAQQDHARSRLHTLARDLRDQVGMRRWRSFKPAPLVSLSAYRAGVPRRSAARRLRPWREAIAS